MSSSTTKAPVKYAWIPLCLVTLLILLIVSGGEEGLAAEGAFAHLREPSPLR